MKKITGWFAAFGLAAALAAGTAGQAYAAPEETQAAAEAVQTEVDTAAAEKVISDAAETAEETAEAAEMTETAEEMQETEKTAQDTAQAEAPAGPGVEKEISEEESAEDTETAEEQLRENVVDYALSFVGGRYVWGGNDPHTGADCSGFVRYVLSNTAGVSMSRTSADQAREGTTVSAEEMQPGDLLFYGRGSSVNHVAMYIGDGQIVHASTAKTGIKVSQWNYRNPIRIASFIG